MGAGASALFFTFSQDIFEISLDLNGISDIESETFMNAVSKWQSVIVGDLPDVQFSQEMIDSSLCGNLPAKVDDLFVCAWYTDIDGVDGVLGWAGPEYVRSDSLLPITGVMEVSFCAYGYEMRCSALR